MKILIGSLLFATAIIINFPELNSSPQPSSRAGPSHANVELEHPQREGRISKRTYITLFGQKIEVDLQKIGNRYEAVDCRVINSRFHIPTKSNRRDINFMTQADFKRVGRNFIRVVIYVREDTQKRRSLLGAKLPPTGQEEYHPDDPKNLNPHYTKWFITYEGVDYEVEVEFVSQKVVDINLRGRPNHRPSHEEIIQNWHEYPYIHFGDVYFFLFRDGNSKIVGVALDPFWKHRPGEEFAHINPHDNPQTSPQINRPLGQNPEPQQNLDQQHLFGQQQNFDQQHHLGQQQNLNPYQNLYQNPYSYDHQTLDPSQYYAQQGDFQLPHFDPSPNYSQEGGFHLPHFDISQLPHFEPNKNWNHPPHHPPNL